MPIVTRKGRQPGDGGADTASNQGLAELQPHHLRNLVFNYLCHNCYLKTAQAFAKDSAVRHLDKDGDEIGDAPGITVGSQGSSTELSDEMVRNIVVRQRIQFEILSGHIEEATAILDQHFPKVLAEDSNSDATETTTTDENVNPSRAKYIGETVNPVHLSLNLRILAFIEACRTVPLSYDPRHQGTESSVPLDSDAATAAVPASHGSKDDEKHQEELLIYVQKLYATVNALDKSEDRAIYLKELWNVGGLLAYPVPEKSPMAKYLHQERRERVAEQINSAILYHTKMPSVSFLELAVRYTHCLWATLHDLRVRVPAAHRLNKGCLPLGTGESEKETSHEARPFNLELFLNTRT